MSRPCVLWGGNGSSKSMNYPKIRVVCAKGPHSETFTFDAFKSPSRIARDRGIIRRKEIKP